MRFVICLLVATAAPRPALSERGRASPAIGSELALDEAANGSQPVSVHVAVQASGQGTTKVTVNGKDHSPAMVVPSGGRGSEVKVHTNGEHTEVHVNGVKQTASSKNGPRAWASDIAITKCAADGRTLLLAAARYDIPEVATIALLGQINRKGPEDDWRCPEKPIRGVDPQDKRTAGSRNPDFWQRLQAHLRDGEEILRDDDTSRTATIGMWVPCDDCDLEWSSGPDWKPFGAPRWMSESDVATANWWDDRFPTMAQAALKKANCAAQGLPTTTNEDDEDTMLDAYKKLDEDSTLDAYNKDQDAETSLDDRENENDE